ncbi:MAG: GAF domain-containing protein [Roseiflexaceae bacterium]|nr:GAF domain-containing protein [Roseiflexaceae bacterium]
MLLLTETEYTAVAGLEMTAEMRQAVLTGNAYLAPQSREIPLTLDREVVGYLWIGLAAQIEPLLTPGFVEALRSQIELLVSIQRRDSVRQAAQADAARELFIIGENGKILSSGLNFETMLARIAENVGLALRVDRCMIHLRDATTPTVLYEVASYAADERDEVAMPRYTVNGQGPLAVLLASSEAQIIDGGEAAQPGDFGFRSALLLPLKARAQVLGLLAVGYTSRSYSFSRSEHNLAQTLTDQVAAVVASAQAYEAEQRRSKEMAALQDLSQRLGAEQPLDETLHAILRGVRGFVPFSGAQVSLYNEEERRLIPALRIGVQSEISPTSAAASVGDGLADWLGRYRRALRLASFEQAPVRLTPLWLANRVAPASYLGMPLLVGDQLVGAIELYGDRPNGFSAEHEQLLQLVAGQAAQAVANARQFARTDAHLRSRVQQLTALQRISRQLTATLSLDLIFSFALEEAIHATPASQAFIALRSSEGEGLRVIDADNANLIATVALSDTGTEASFSVLAVAGYAADDQTLVGQRLELTGTAAGAAITSGEPQLIEELDTDDRLNRTGVDVAAVLAMPIYYENQTVGVVNLHSSLPRAFDHDTMEFVRALTDSVSLALGNALRYEEQQRQRTLLQQRASMLKQVLDIGHALRADRSLEEVLEQIAFSIIDAGGFRRALFNVADADDAETLRVSTGAGLALSELERMRGQPWPSGLVERVLDKQFRVGRCFFVPEDAALLLDDGLSLDAITSQTDIILTGSEDWHAGDSLFVPLYSTDARLLGVLSVDEPYNHLRPTTRTLEVLEVLAAQAAMAIENSNLLREARAQTDQMRALYQVGAAAVSTFSLAELLGRVYAEIVAYMGPLDYFRVVSFDQPRATLRFELCKIAGETVAADTGRVAPKGGLDGRVIDADQTLVVGDLANDTLAQSLGEAANMRAWVGVPLRSQSKVIGVLSVQSQQPHAFAERHIRFLESLANQLAIALENTRLFEEREHRIAELGVISDIGRITSTTLDLTAMFSQVFVRLQSFLTIDAGYIFAYDARSNLTVMALEVDEGERTVVVEPRPVSRGGLTERILQTRQPLLFHNLAQERTPSGVVPLAFGSVTRRSASWLGVPLMGTDAEIVGVMSIQSYTASLYSEREMTFLTAVAHQLALGVQNARLFSQTERHAETLGSKVGELSTLLEAARVLSSSLKPDEVLNRLMDVVGSHLHVSTVGLWKIAPDQTLRPAALLGIPQDIAAQMTVPVGQGLTGRVAAMGSPLVVMDVEQDGSSLYPDFNRARSLTSFMGVPVSYRGEIIGVLSVMTTQARQFNADEQALLAGMADQAAIALENARLFQERDRRIAELTSFNSISSQINATLDLDTLLAILHTEISRVLESSASFIALYDASSKQISYPIFWDGGKPSPETGEVSTLDAPSLSRRVINERRPVLLHTRAEMHRYMQEAGYSDDVNSPIASWLSVPMIEDDEVFGILNVQSTQPNAFDGDDERFLITVAGLAGTAIARAHLFAERGRRLNEISVLQEIGSAITSTLDLQGVLEGLHSQLGRVIDVSTSFIGLYDARTRILTYPVAFDLGQPALLTPALTDGGINHYVINQRRPLLLGTNAEADQYRSGSLFDGRVGPEDKLEQSYLVVPIISGEAVLGVINIQSYEHHAFDKQDLRFVTAVASQASVAITNARLFQERGRRIEELSTFNDIGQQLSAVPKLNELLDLIYRQTSRLLDTTNFYIGIYDEHTDIIRFPLYYESGTLVAMPPVDAPTSLSHHVVRTRAPFLLQNSDQTARLRDLGITPIGQMSQSWLGVPMLANQQVIGLIGIQDYTRDDAYSDDDVRLLSTLSSWGAVALANANLFAQQDQSLQELGILYDTSMQLAGTLDATEIQRQVVLNAQELLQVQVGALILFGDKQQVAQHFVYDQELLDQSAYAAAAPSDAMLKRLIGRDKPIILRDADDLAQSGLAAELGLRTLVGDLIGPRDAPLGLLWLGERQPRDWQSRELSMVSLLATLSSQGLKSAALFVREQQRREVADTLRDLAERLTGKLELREVYDLILTQLARVVQYDSVSLMLREGESDIVRVVATRGFPENERADVERLSFNVRTNPNLGVIAQSRRPLLIDDAQASGGFEQVAGISNIRAWLGAPILLGDELIGVLTVDNAQVGAYDQEDAQVTFALASQAAQAIRTARLFEEKQRFNTELEQRVIERTAELAELNTQLADEKERLQAVHAVTVELTASLELGETLRKTLQLAAKNLGVRRGSIMLYDEQQRQLVCRAVLGEDGNVHEEHITIKFEQGIGLAGWVREHQQGILIGDVRKDRRWVQAPGRASDVRSVIAVPLRTQDVGTLGVLILTSPSLNYFSKAQEQLLTTIANEVAIVIHNAELYSLVNDIATKLAVSVQEKTEESTKNQAILRSLGEGVVVLDEFGKVILVNSAAETILGIAELNILGQPLSDLPSFSADADDLERLTHIYTALNGGLRSMDAQGRSQQQRLELTNPAQSIELYFTPVLSPAMVVFGSVVVMRDVTREIEADRAKRDFISGVSHELRTPLTAIKGYVDLLNMGAAGPVSEAQQSFLGVIKNNANRLMDLINDILEIGRLDANKIQLHIEPIDMREIFRDALQTLRSEIERKQMRVSIEVADDLPKIGGDERRLTQVVLNMLSNAVKYTYIQGQIELRASLNRSGMLQVDVEDNGVGISAEQQQYLFRRFYRADNPLREEAGGTGLGLAIAKSFIELHGGEMWLRSASGEGSTFSFVVPVDQPERPLLEP